MKYCNYCKVQIRGNRNNCPLCSNILADVADTEVYKGQGEIFPSIPPIYEYHLAMRIMIFISVVAIVISFVVYIIYPIYAIRPTFVILGLISMWLSLIMVLWKRHNIAKNILWQVIIVSFMAVIWDWNTGWKGWSLSYVIPILVVAATIVMYVSAKIMKLSVSDYIAYLFLDGLLGIVPVIFILFHLVEVTYPSILSVAASVIFLAAILIFQGENIKMELNKRMHL